MEATLLIEWIVDFLGIAKEESGDNSKSGVSTSKN
jgi:hypothetical protein